MGWTFNKLEKSKDVTYIPGSPAIPGTEGTAGSPAYTYYETTTIPGATYVDGPPSGWDNEITIPLPGGGYQIIQSGGYRYFDGVKAYLTAIIAGVDYVYEAPDQEVTTQVFVPAVDPVPATPPVPATEAQIIEDYNLGWNAGATRLSTLLVNEVFTWKWSAGNVGVVVGLTLATAQQDQGYTGMAFSLMAQSGRWELFNGPTPNGGSTPFMNNDRFALKRTDVGTIELYINGGLVHTEVLADDVVPDCSIYSGGDVIWDAEILSAAVAPLTSNTAASTLSDAVADATAINITRYVGPNTAIGVVGATTASDAVNGSVVVNGAVNTGSIDGTTISNAVSVNANLGVQQTFGPNTAKGVVSSSTDSDAVATGDPATGVGISTNTSVSSNCNMLPITGAASGPNVADGWTGNFVGASINMLPMTVDASGDLAAPVIGLADLVMVPMNTSAIGLTGEVSISSTGNMLPLAAFASSETAYSQGYGSMTPMQGVGTDEPYDDLVDQVIEVVENILATGSIQSNYAIFITELLQTASPTQLFSQLGVDLLDALSAIDAIQLSLAVTVAESLSFNSAGELDVVQAMKVYEQLMALDSIQSSYTAAAIILAAIGVSDNKITGGSIEGGTDAAPLAAYVRLITEMPTATDSLGEAILLLATLTDQIDITDSTQNVLTIAVIVQEDADIADSMQLSATLLQNIQEYVEILAFIKTPAELTQGWVMNTEGKMPISEYSNYTFNSLAYSPDEMLGCNDNGLYILDGDTDAGENIDAHITSLMLDFDTTKLKRMSTAYIGYTSTGELLLKVRSEEQGIYTERWYAAREDTAQPAPSQNRMKIGKGLRSRYWTFELTNVDGSDFELDKVELYPIILERRV
jgi:hypothetical protein